MAPLIRRASALAGLVLLLVACGAPPAPPPPPLNLVWPSPPDPARVRYVGSLSKPEDIEAAKSWLRRVWDVIAGREDIHIQRPYGVAADREGRVYVADAAGRVVHVFDTRERRYRGIKELGRRRFEMPIGVAVAADGTVYVSDSELRVVVALDSRGKLLREFGRDLARPTGLALSPAGDRLYVVDTLGHQIAIFDPSGRRTGTIGGRGDGAAQFNFPTNIAVDRAGLLHVSDTMNFQVKVLRPDGTPVTGFGKLGDGTGDMNRPKGLGVDSEGHIYVVEGLHDVVQIFDRQGQFLLAIGGTGHEHGHFWLPTGLHVDHQDRIYVADSYNNRIEIFEYLRGLP